MKKILLFAMGAMMAMPSFAQQGEDVTHLIKNAGFDEDLTFQADGTMKEAVSTTTSLSDRSWAYIAADSTVYARPISTSKQQRKDGRKEEAVNGFKGRVKGWTLESNSEFPKCEWTYFGTVSYDLPETAIPIADDGDTYLLVPSRPENGEFEAGEGFVYLRAGWTNEAIYKQVVNLPCAVYRLEYWTININPNTTSTATDLSQIKCRNDIFKDEEGTGLQAKVWTKHEFTFTPTAEFTMQFGYKAANAGSGGQPIVALDGIKLYKIADANPDEIVNADLNSLKDSLDFYSINTEKLNGVLATEINNYATLVDDVINGDDENILTTEQKEAFITVVKEKLEYFKKAIAAIENIETIANNMAAIKEKYTFPGLTTFNESIDQIAGYATNGTAEQILGAEAEAQAAIKTYVLSQEASTETPANFTPLVKSPWFIKTEKEPTIETEGVVSYSEVYTDGKSSEDFSSEGWYKSGAYTGGDQRLNFAQGRSCWNAWGSSISTIGIAQDLTDLPNGFYTVSADLITQSDCVTNQHVFATTELGTFESTPLMSGDWSDDGNGIYGTWSTLSVANVLVTDGKLTIGAAGNGQGNTNSSGWFCVTNFRLEYNGAAGDDALAILMQQKLNEANEIANTMHFAADKKAMNDSIEKYQAVTTDLAPAIAALNNAITMAKASEAKYAEYWMDGKTLPTLRDSLQKEGAYEAAKEIAQFAYNFSMNWLESNDASYTKIDSVVNLTKNYLNTYIPVYNEAVKVAETASDAGKQLLNDTLNSQKATLLQEMQTAETVNNFVNNLKNIINGVKKQNIVDDETINDYTLFIINPNAEGTDGWVIDKGNGDGPIKTGQWLDGTNAPYFDSWNSNGLSGYTITQLVKDLPNGTYTLGAYVRTPAEGAYLLAKVAGQQDTTFVEIPLYYYYDETSESNQVASDKYGPIWEEAKTKIVDEAMTEEDPEYAKYFAIYNANSTQGRGWQKLEIPSLNVTDHTLLIGTATGSEALGTDKVFAGSWYSVNGWTLTLTQKGDNTNWGGPISGVAEIVKNMNVTLDGIYSMTGVRTNKLQRGLNIVIRNGKATKVMVK